MKCVKCGVELARDDIGLTRKLLGKTLTDCYCVKCLSDKLGVSETRLREKIEEFKKSGCTLFKQ